jgi:hypothetical protein
MQVPQKVGWGVTTHFKRKHVTKEDGNPEGKSTYNT